MGCDGSLLQKIGSTKSVVVSDDGGQLGNIYIWENDWAEYRGTHTRDVELSSHDESAQLKAVLSFSNWQFSGADV